VVAQLSRRADTGMWCCGAGSSRVASSYPSGHHYTRIHALVTVKFTISIEPSL
jgi:hypothetical protein